MMGSTYGPSPAGMCLRRFIFLQVTGLFSQYFKRIALLLLAHGVDSHHKFPALIPLLSVEYLTRGSESLVSPGTC